MSSKIIQLNITGMHCASCVAGIESALSRVPGVEKAAVNFAARSAQVNGTAEPAAIIAALKAQGYEASLMDHSGHQHHVGVPEIAEYHQRLWQSLVAAIVGIPLLVDAFIHFIPEPKPYYQWYWILIGLIVYSVMWFSGRQIYRGFWQSLKSLRGNMDTLVGMGTGVAWLYSMIVVLFPGFIPALARHVYFDTTGLLLAFITFGNALELKARGKTSQAIQKLIGLKPKTARIIRDDHELDIDIDQIQLGDRLRLRPGEKVAVDGVVVEGDSQINEAMLTGEAMPVHKKTQDKVFAGTVNKSGSVIYRATGIGKDTALSRIIDMVQQAQNSKPTIARLVDKISGIFVPIVLLCMVLTVIGWSLWGPQPVVAYVLTTGVAVLVIACPCALGLATPISIMVGVGKAAELGLLVRNGESLQMATKVNTIVFDKTGTLTEGKPSVAAIHSVDGVSDNELLHVAASLEVGSEHPLAEAIMTVAHSQKVEVAAVQDFKALSGLGVTALLENETVVLGNERFMQQFNVNTNALQKVVESAMSQGQTPVYIAQAKQLRGVIVIADVVKADSKQAVQQLHARGIKTVMLTGDTEKTAQAIAKQVGIDQVIAGVLPDQKAQQIQSLQAQGNVVAMVGDGINDAPALTQADIGIAIGKGADVAIEAADMALMTSSLLGVVAAITLSKKTMRNIKENLFGAFIYNTIGIPLAAGVFYPLGHWLLSPLIGGAAMALSSVTVVLNANRLRFFKIK